MTLADFIETGRLRLRRPDPSDLPAYADYCRSPRSVHVGGPFDRAQSFEKFAAFLGHWQLRGFGRYTITLEDRPIGHAGPLQRVDDMPPELTWTLWDGAAEGRGYATEAARGVCGHLFGDLGWPLLDILIRAENRASRAVAERLGAVRSESDSPARFPGAVAYQLTPARLQ